ncbi:LacI family DNA-binding transcriptional regulator [Paenibacillus agaridevorans]|uniref:LacI family DNA-binding transcriptional regulator n=1 Tax=Paenibacillus agaridevorans TaxID=171404 RepID=UPI001BE4A0BB|nr:LacI family DNA-binding transcriptional regulator [Paenibacillus agaridevorans]
MVTIKEIAKAAGVSPATVSRALSGSDKVTNKTRKLIERLADELNYMPNYSAKALIGKGTSLVGLIVPEISSNYFAQVIEYVESALYNRGYSLIMGTTGWDLNKGLETLKLMIGRNVDGIIYADNSNMETGAYFQAERRLDNFPIVLLNRYGGTLTHESVVVEEAYGIDLLVKHFAKLGHRAIGYLGEEKSTAVRLPLFKQALSNAGLPYEEKFIKANGTERFEEGGYLRMKELLAEDRLPTAVFATYDYFAIGALRAAHEAGLNIPRDLSIAGFDNIRETGYMIPTLTTVSPPIREMSNRAVDILIEKINNPGSGNNHAVTAVYPSLIERESTGAPGQISST